MDVKFNKNNQAHLTWLGPVRMLVILIIAFGYASTMPIGPGNPEYGNMLGYDPSWFGIEILFLLSGFLAMRSLDRHGSGLKLLLSRIIRNTPQLVIFAIIVIFVLFPLLGNGISLAKAEQHFSYFLKVVTCYDPDEITPGLLDNALYMCVIQGGIWTFRWGAIAFIGTALGWAIGALKNRYIVITLTLLMVILYGLSVMLMVKNPELASNKLIELANIGLRLGWIYLAGMSLYYWWDKFPKTPILAIIFIGIATVQYIFLPWSVAIEISASFGFGLLALLAATSQVKAPKIIKKLPDLSLGLYIYTWPTSQIILLLIPELSSWQLIGLSLPATIIIAWLSWFLISRNTNLYAQKILQPKPFAVSY